MADALTPLIRDFLEWVGTEPRPYAEAMEAWRTSCPRLTAWENTVDRGFIAQRRVGQELLVTLTPLGHDFLSMNT